MFFFFLAWEARMDSHGRVFYIDHATRTTSWVRPGGNSSTVPNGSGAEQHRRQLDRRYQSIRRTISSNRLDEVDYLAAPPGCRLLSRPDFFTILHMNQVYFTEFQFSKFFKIIALIGCLSFI